MQEGNEKIESFESFSYTSPPSICPGCQQPYICQSMLHNPDRLIYVHRQSTGASKNAVDWCVDPASRHEQQARLSAAIEACNQINEIEVEKGVDRRLQEMAQSKSSMKSSKAVVVPKSGSHRREVSQEMGFSEQGKRGEAMAFVGFDLVKLKEEFPSAGVGRAGKPSVAISDKGRITFSTEVSKIFDGCKFVIPSRDKDNQLRVRFDGHSEVPNGKAGQVIEISRSKPKDGKKGNKNAALQAVVILKALKYDFSKAGNQTYEVEKMDQEKHVVIFSLPATLPAKKAKKPRVKKEKVAAAGTNGAPKGPTPQLVSSPVHPLPNPASGAVDDLAIEE